MSMSMRIVGLSLASFALASAAVPAAEFRLFPDSVPASHYLGEAGVADEAIGPRVQGFTAASAAEAVAPRFGTLGDPSGPTDPSATAPKLFTKSTKWTTAIALAGITLWAGLGVQKDDYNPWHNTREKYFGKDTYAGGADKCSHFILSASYVRELGWIYEQQGHSRDQSLALSLGVTLVSGVIQEIGDAFTPYGYSWEDIAADTAGALTGAFLTRHDLDDLVGVRFGFVPEGLPDSTPNDPSLGEQYSHEIYSGDLKLAGLAKRLNVDIGPARFLLLSATYQTKAYGFEPPRPDRGRYVGVDIGLNVPEILAAAGVPQTTWWGTALYKALNIFRIPFTAFGWHYNLNKKTWHGPDTGNKLD
jgi:uncharacterized protein YfiM (DUF2279 family)